MNQTDLSILILTVIAAAMAGVVVYLSVRGAPGVVSLSPPESSPRWPVYGFFIPWFLAAVTNSSQTGGSHQGWLIVSAALFVLVLVAFVISTVRHRRHPSTPPRT